MESESKLLSDNPPLERPFFCGMRQYAATPSFEQLKGEIREYAYFLWERFGWDADQCWLIAEKALFSRLEDAGLGASGYRIVVRSDVHTVAPCDYTWEVKIITPRFPVVFLRLDGEEKRAKEVPLPAVVTVARRCHPPTLCSLTTKDAS